MAESGMNPEEYHKALEGLVVRHPVAMSSLIQAYGPLPDGESDEERAVIVGRLTMVLEGVDIVAAGDDG